MNVRRLGSSGLLVSPICLGTMTFGTPVGEADSISLLHQAIDLGVNFIDTANVYEGYRRYLGSPGGVAEEIVGKALAGRRDKVVLATKVGAPLGPGPQDRGLSATHILREVDNSLRRLRTEYIDLYIMHWPDRMVPLDVSLAAIDQAVRQGKVRAVGASNHTAWQLCEMQSIAREQRLTRVSASQIAVSLLRREWEHDLEFCARHDIAVTPYQSLQGGLLTGKYRRGGPMPADSRAAEKPEWVWKLDAPLFDRLEAIEGVAREVGLSMTALSLGWALARPAVASIVVGAKGILQVEEAVKAATIVIERDVLSRLDAISPPPWRPIDPVR